MTTDTATILIPNNVYISEDTVDTLNQVGDGLSYLRDSFMQAGHGDSQTLEYAARQGVMLQLQAAIEALDYEAQRLQQVARSSIADNPLNDIPDSPLSVAAQNMPPLQTTEGEHND